MTQHRFSRRDNELWTTYCRRFEGEEEFREGIDALATLLMGHAGVIEGLANTTPGIDGSDLFQEVFLRLAQTESRYEGRSAPRSYLYAVVRNTFLDLLRKRPHCPLDDALDFQDQTTRTPEELVMGVELFERCGLAMDKLLPRNKRILELRLEGHPYRAIQEIMGVSYGVVGHNVFLARQIVADSLLPCVG